MVYKTTNITVKGKRGQKICPKCNTPTGPRTQICKDEKCGYIFTFKGDKPEPANKKVKWEELKWGEYIKVIKGTGPYWLKKDKTKVPMGYKGIYRVVGVVPTHGIQAYHVKHGGYAFIWMGPKCQAGDMIRRPHKLVRVRPKNRD